MSFAVKLVTEEVSVEPGGSVPVAFDVTYSGVDPDRLELTVEGIDPEWVAVPVPSFVLEPGQGRTERFFLKPPRESHSTAGNYPFVVRVRSLETGDAVTVQGVLEVKPYTHVSVDAQPRKVSISPFRRSAEIAVNIANLGNTSQAMQLMASDTDGVIAFEFDKDQIRLEPGQQATAVLNATASANPFLANPRLQPVTVSARSVSSPAVGATTSLQVEQRGLISVANAIFLVVLFLLGVAWYVTRPKQPSMDILTAVPMNPIVGSNVVVRWSAQNATSVEVNVGGMILDKQPTVGEYTFTTKNPGKLTITAIAVGEKNSPPLVQVVDVLPKIEAPVPQIASFTADSATVPVGQSVFLRWKVNEAVTSLSLSPIGVQLDPRNEGYQLRSDKPGALELKLIARNADGKVDEKVLTVRFVTVSQAVIDSFECLPDQISGPGGKVTLRWTTRNAYGAQITYGDVKIPITSQQGETVVEVTQETTFTLTVVDNAGVAASKRVKVSVVVPEAPSPDAGKDAGLRLPPKGSEHPAQEPLKTGGKMSGGGF
jgi:hypothetical protein